MIDKTYLRLFWFLFITMIFAACVTVYMARDNGNIAVDNMRGVEVPVDIEIRKNTQIDSVRLDTN